MRHPADSLQGKMALAWFDYYVRDRGTAPPQNFAYYRDWVYNTTHSIDEAYATAPTYPVGTLQTWYLSGSSTPAADGALVPSQAQVVPGLSAYSSTAPVGPNYTETSGADQTAPVTDPPGSAIRFATAPLAADTNVVGSPRLTVQLTAPTVALTQRAGPAGRLVVYAKALRRRAGERDRTAAPADLTRPGRRRHQAGDHRAAGDRPPVPGGPPAGGGPGRRRPRLPGSTLPQPVALVTGPGRNQQLTVPVVN